MAIIKTVHKYERVVPVRFARAPDPNDPTVASGTYDENAPEPDDRGFLPHSTGGAIFPIGLDPAVDAAARPETRVRLIRMDIENSGQLFVTSENTGIFEITLPAANAVLPSTKEMMIKVKAVAAGQAHLQVRFGTIDGPIIHQMQVRVNRLIPVNVFAHVPIINGAPFVNPSPPPAGAPFPTAQGATFPAQSAQTDASIRQMITNANKIFFPYGIRMDLNAVIDRTAPGDATGTRTLTTQGFVAPTNADFSAIAAVNRQPRAINAYFVTQISNPAPAGPINQTAGMALSARENPGNYALFIADWTVSFQSIAHEIGHLFNLPNDPTGQMDTHVNTRTDPSSPGTGVDVRFDTISRRRLMWAFTGFFATPGVPPAPRGHDLAIRDDVGYGNDTPGGMLTIKALTNDLTDREMTEAQATAGALP